MNEAHRSTSMVAVTDCKLLVLKRSIFNIRSLDLRDKADWAIYSI